jgi:hypothetical protein
VIRLVGKVESSVDYGGMHHLVLSFGGALISIPPTPVGKEGTIEPGTLISMTLKVAPNERPA